MNPFLEREEREGIRWSWNAFPSSRLEATRMVVPLGCLFTPLKQLPGLPVLSYDPVLCKTCKAVLNPYCQVDYRSKLWQCPFCLTRNNFPPFYSDIGENNIPAELHPQYTAVEYRLAAAAPGGGRQTVVCPPPAFVYVIDTCIDVEKEWEALKDSISLSFNLLPPDAIISFITFGTTVQVHELGNTDSTKVYCFRGNKEVTTQQLVEFLSTPSANPQPPKEEVSGARRIFDAKFLQEWGGGGSQTQGQTPPHLPEYRRYLVPLSEAEVQLSSLIDELKWDPWPVPPDHRPLRATGAALSAAVALLESTFRGYGGRIMLFLSGPCTQGPGQTVSDDLSEYVRMHNDLKAETAPFWNKSKKFFDSMLPRCVQNGHAIDVFVGALDQTGVAEMKSLIEGTGGTLLLSDSFANSTFKQSFQRFFTRADNQLQMAFNATLDVFCTPEWRVSGVIGPCISKGKKSSCVAETEVGIGGTSQWGMSALGPATTFGVYFEPVTMNPAGGGQRQQYRFAQFITSYQHPTGERRVRVTSTAHRISDTTNNAELATYFDQEAAAVLLARISVFKAESEHLFDVLRWLDRHLIRLVAKFAEYTKDDPTSLRLSSQFSLFPQFVFHLRRSEFLQVFNNSPDETAYYRITLDRESCSNCLIMIQPTLHSYTLTGPPTPVLLDSTSVQVDCILLMDTFFDVVIHSGEVLPAELKPPAPDNRRLEESQLS
eukprot:TRINITY_DN11632_c0_g1_i2.p1 TRINITY_DN11632_c0_g1~~TRINITY_DN11632_c0_g1_i2.p1  ORF type:complete len:713 (-),score=115.79 TRINITY_DN11632_c0_g1_i2:3043-5181(-)